MELHSEGRNAIRRYTRSLKSLSDNDQSNFSDPTFDYSNGGFVSEFDSNVGLGLGKKKDRLLKPLFC